MDLRYLVQLDFYLESFLLIKINALTVPTIIAEIEATRTANFAICSNSIGKANFEMNSDIVKPIPAIFPKTKMWRH